MPGDNVPHMFQRTVRLLEPGLVEVDGRSFRLGHASGASNNCLVDSLRQAVSTQVDLDFVRDLLRDRFRDGPERVVEANFLTLDYHGLAVLDALLQHGRQEAPGASEGYTIVCVDMGCIGNGDVVGVGPLEVFIARAGGNHFVPLAPVP